MKLKHSILCASMALAIPAAAFAMGGASGPHTNSLMQGHLGEVMMNPYGIWTIGAKTPWMRDALQAAPAAAGFPAA